MRNEIERKLYEQELSSLLEQAISELNFVKNGTVFQVKDLFKGHQWRGFENNLKIKLTTKFYSAVKKLKSIEILDNTGMGYQKYKKL